MTEEENQLLIEHACAMPAAGYAYAKILHKDAPMEELISLGKIEQCSQTIPLNRMALRKAQIYYLQGFHHFGKSRLMKQRSQTESCRLF